MRGRGKSSTSHPRSVCAASAGPQLGSRLAPGGTHQVQVGAASHPQGCSQSK